MSNAEMIGWGIFLIVCFAILGYGIKSITDMYLYFKREREENETQDQDNRKGLCDRYEKGKPGAGNRPFR